jgi:hypothetical protein
VVEDILLDVFNSTEGVAGLSEVLVGAVVDSSVA